MKTKTCSSCNKEKPMTEFPLGCLRSDGTRYGDGRHSHCKACHRKRWRARQKAMTPEEIKARYAKQKIYRGNHPHAMRAKWANERAKDGGVRGRITEADIITAWNKYDGRCWVCGDLADCLDHYRPINKKSGGENTADNIRPICRECNHKRSHNWHGNNIAKKEAEILKELKALLNGTV